MSNRRQPKARKASDNYFRLNPLAAGVRVVMAGGLLVGSVAPGHAGSLPVPVPGQGWVSSGAASNQIIGNTLRIDQKTDRAILNWQKFDVGRENTVQFVQPGSSSIALNRIHDSNPSQILGQIIANGQVYLYNKNGFVFGKDSVVNTNSFLASTLEITDEAFNRGITRVFDENGSAALGVEGVTLDPKTVKILIEAGAKIHADKAGRIIIAAPNIENRGSLSTDEQGQVILAASQDKVYLQAADKKSPFAGLVVEVDTGGKVSNLGNILARQGNVTLAGFAVNQQGRISATSSVNVNGSIRLLAQEKHGTQGAKLIATKTSRDVDLSDGLGTQAKTTFAAGSVTQVVADANGGSAIDEQAQPDSYLEVTGNTVRMQSGSTIKVPGGKVDITATDNLADPTQGSRGRIHLEKGAVIDVSGTKGVVVHMERNVGEVSVQSYELRNAPLQSTGVLKGETVRVDLRKGSKIVDTSGAEARISRGIDERLGVGGEINLTSSGDVIVDSGAKIDISGGSVNYQDGYIKTTKLLTEYGSIVDISDADPDEHYLAIFGTVTETHEKWGVEKVWDLLGQIGLGQFERGYVEGLAAGGFNIKAPRVAWNGDLLAGSVAGRYQRDMADVPFGGSFDIDMAVFRSLQNVRFQTEGNSISVALDEAFPEQDEQRPVDLVIATRLLNDSGVKDVSIKTWGNASLTGDASIQMQPGGSLSVAAGNIEVFGRVKAAGGNISLIAAHNDHAIDAGQLTVATQAALDVSGLWVNDFQKDRAVSLTDPLAIDGGMVKLQAEGDLLVSSGSSIRADGGAWLPVSDELNAGKGGDITLAAVGNGSVASTLTMGGELSAYGVFENGGLTLASGKILVGNPDAADDLDQSLVLGVSDGDFDFSKQLAFSRITLAANFDDLTVKSNVNLNLRQKNLELLPGYQDAVTGSSLRDFSRVVELPEHLRQPMTLSLNGTSSVELATGSYLALDKQSSLDLNTTAGSIFVDGVISTLAGSINLAINPTSALDYDSTQSIWLGEHGRLLVQGDTRLNPVDELGKQSGTVLNGGNVTFDANRGYVVLEKGSLIDVSGTHGQLDILQSGLGTNAVYNRVEIGSNAGKIAVTAAEGMVLDGDMRGFSGSDTNSAGRLELTLDRLSRKPPEEPNIPFPNGPLVVNVRQSSRQQLGSTRFGDVISDDLSGQATVSADKIMGGGFDDVRLKTPDQVVFQGNVDLKTAARIDIDSKVVDGSAAGAVNLETGYLKLGSSVYREINSQPLLGNADFSTHAKWIELQGALQWNGFANISLNSDHDLRTVGLRLGSQRDFLGTLVTAANLNLHADQIYPSTLTDYSLVVENNPSGQINVSGSDSGYSPLSAAGRLTLKAPVINQRGVLKAPLGSINLIAGKRLTLGEGSVTSVSAAGQIIPFGVVQSGMDWLYPLVDPQNLVFDTPPSKQVVLSGPEVVLEKNSKIDISGGGDLQAYEFKPVADDFPDYLQPGSASYEGSFAVLPALGSALAPYDPYQSNGWDYEPGSRVYLNGTDQLPAGYYTILPPHYALMPGAFLVTPQANSLDHSVTTFTKDRLPIVSGYQALATNGTRDSRTSAYRIESSEQVLLKHPQYDIYNANSFYTQKAAVYNSRIPLLPKDSGQISIIAESKLSLDGMIDVAAPGGRGAKMNIAADNIKIVDRLDATPATGVLEILDSDLNNLNIASLLLGGDRKINASSGATDISVTADSVVFDSGVKLHTTDLVAVANDKIEVKKDAKLSADGSVNTGDSQFNVAGDGAFLRLSGDEQISLNRTGQALETGELNIHQGASLFASKSMFLEASKSTTLDGDILMRGGSLDMTAGVINLGEGGAANALNLSAQTLAKLTVDELVLSSRGNVNLYGNLGLPGDKPLQFGNLVIDATGLAGYAAKGQIARLQTSHLTFQNSKVTLQNSKDHPPVEGSGLGRLELHADEYSQGKGQFDITGFSNINVMVNKGFSVADDSVLKLGADTNLQAAYLTAAGGKSLAMDAGAHALKISGTASGIGLPASNAFGGSFDITANSILFDTHAVAYSGKLALHALAGDVLLGSAADIDMAGRGVTFADVTEFTPGGTFTANAEHGQVIMASGSKLDISSGGGSAAGGRMVLKAQEHSVTLNGKIKATGGSAEIDEATDATGTAFNTLMNTLNNAGINQSFDFRMRDADITLAANNTIRANKLTLVADKGNIDVFGTINTLGSASNNSAVSLYAGDKVILEDGSSLSTHGKVMLSSVDGDNDGISGIAMKSGATIDVGNDGEVSLRALRTADGINIDQFDGTIKTPKPIYAIGVQKYTNADLGNDGSIDLADINTIKADNESYMTAANINNVAALGGQHLSLMAGAEIDYNGDLTLKDSWDLAGWRYNGNPGELAVRASGNLQFDQSLSDGFASGHATFTLSNKNWDVLLGDKLLADKSWSYVLTAGADIASADSNRTATSGDLVVGSNVKIRTGTGDMKINAGGDINFSAGSPSAFKKLSLNAAKGSQFLQVANVNDWKVGAYLKAANNSIASGTTITKIDGPVSGKYKVYLSVPTVASISTSINVTANYADGTIYNAGQASSTNPYGTLGDPAVALSFYSEYPVNGGDLTLSAGGNINGRISGHDYNDWLLRLGNPDEPTAWGVAFGFVQSTSLNNVVFALPSTNSNKATSPLFQQNVGSFGGGNVTAKAAGDISNLEVMMPSTGKPTGNNTDLYKLDGYTSKKIDVQASGNMQINAGGNIAGGSYFLANNYGTLNAGRQVTSGDQYSNGPALFSSDRSSFSVTGTTGVQLSGVFNPMIAHSGNVNFFGPFTDSNALTVSSLSGDILLAADNSAIAIKYGFSSDQTALSEIYPASLQVAALGGSVVLKDSITLFPAANGQLNIFADQNITAADGSGSYYLLGMSDADVSLLPSVFSPLAAVQLGTSVSRISPYGLAEFIHAPVPVHSNDSRPARVVTLQGDIADIGVNLPKKALIKSGRDISNIGLAVQNINPDDTTILDAGRDLVFPSDRDPLTGGLTQRTSDLEALNEPGIKVAGPGEVLVKSGRNIDFGASNGLTTVANAYNPALSETGAGITVMAGLNGAAPDYAGFISKYFSQADYADDLQIAKSTIIQFVKSRSGNSALTDDEALQAFSKLQPNDYLTIQPKLNAMLVPVYLNEVRQSGKAAAAKIIDSEKRQAYERGYAAIESFFPGANWKGDLSLYFSKLQTLKGGDINLFVPGGEINAGLAVSVSGAKSADKLGVVVQGEGNINAVLRDDFLVNKSRVFALNGGNIMVWTSKKNIDAGKGAKSSISAPPPIITVDKNGNLKIEFPPIVSGSGIRTAASSAGVEPGDVFLFAPKGVVDAGEAGIGGNNVFIAATAVLGANNIQVSGVGTGVPVASTGSVAAGLTGTSNMTAGVSEVAESSVTANNDKDKSAAMKNAVLGMLSVEVLGFGE